MWSHIINNKNVYKQKFKFDQTITNINYFILTFCVPKLCT